MFFVRVDESHRARPHLRAPALHGQLDSSFPDKPHFSVEMEVRRVGSSARRQSGLVDFHGLARGEFAFEEVANYGGVRCPRSELLKGIHRSGQHSAFVGIGFRWKDCRNQDGRCQRTV